MGDGIQNGQRVTGFGNRQLASKVVDNTLHTPFFGARLLANAKKFEGTSYDITMKITNSNRSEWFVGLETLNSSAANTTVTASYRHTALTTPVVSVMLESFANTGEYQEIDLDMYNIEEAEAELREEIGSAVFGTGAGNEILGLEAIVDDGTNVSTIGGLSRSTVAAMNAQVVASGGTLSIAKLGDLYDRISSANNATEEPTINVTTKDIFSLYEQLLAPQVRADYQAVGYPRISIRGNVMMKLPELQGNAGFTALAFRGVPVIKDDFCTSGVWYALNERYLFFVGRYQVPKKYAGQIKKVDLGKPSTIEGAAAMPSKFNGIFFQEEQMLPNQAGMIGRFYLIGQLVCSQYRRQGKLTDITSI